ncbi:7154_t:CDS:2 [Cetraspora pellucida]|uniref:7154_t:CDS:1 n=1 Tax=Cetraspora pellucida TaxID=1433469 RepID=A0A9N9PGX1_9GLOM|nr:7154_t:CDS:2 [Cetraspora pellucida]
MRSLGFLLQPLAGGIARIVADESGQGEKKILVECFMFWNSVKNMPDVILLETKDLQCCNSDTVSQALSESCTKYGFDTMRCLTFLSDNTNYMSGHIGGAITKFNQLTKSNCIRISCGLHILHLILNNFEETAFGKLPANTGFSKTWHPFNLLYLVWMLHDRYDRSDKDLLLNIRSETIRGLYKAWLDYQLTKYQQSLRSRWQYELITAEQYLEQ